MELINKMKTEAKIKRLEKMGYKVSYVSGNRNGNLSIIGVVATKDGRRHESTSMTGLYQLLN